MNKTTVCVVFGGASSEHDVSLMSAKNVVSALDVEKYFVELINIDQSGKWFSVDEVREPIASDETVLVDIASKQFVCHKTNRKIRPHVVFPVLHGKFGEDGTIQGLFELMQLPYVGCDVEASALCMDKIKTKKLLEAAGLRVVPSCVVTDVDDLAHFTVPSVLGDGPWFVKPSRAGSSVGVSKVADKDGVMKAIELALQHDREVLVEMAVHAPHEIEVAVLGNPGDIHASAPGEIVPSSEFYTYDDKYSASSQSHAEFALPESLRDMSDSISHIAKKVYEVLGCVGLSRVDFLVTDDRTVYVNEVNTMPGFTNISMYPKLMEKDGVDNASLVDKLISLALEKERIVKV